VNFCSFNGNTSTGCTTGVEFKNTCDRIAGIGNIIYNNTANLVNNATNSDINHNIIA